MHDERTRDRGYTLLELVVALIVISIISAAVMPVIVGATDAYAATRDARSTADDAAFAASTVVRLIQEAPGGDTTRLAITSADAESIRFDDGTGLRLDGETLTLLTPEGNGPLARSVSTFRLIYLGPDGRTPAEQPADAHRIHVTLTIGSFSISTAAFPRVNIGEGQ